MVILRENSWCLLPQGKQIKSNCFRDLCQIAGNSEKCILQDKITCFIFTMFSSVQHTHLQDNILEYQKYLFWQGNSQVRFNLEKWILSRALCLGKGLSKQNGKERENKNFDGLQQRHSDNLDLFIDVASEIKHGFIPRRFLFKEFILLPRKVFCYKPPPIHPPPKKKTHQKKNKDSFSKDATRCNGTNVFLS